MAVESVFTGSVVRAATSAARAAGGAVCVDELLLGKDSSVTATRRPAALYAGRQRRMMNSFIEKRLIIVFP